MKLLDTIQREITNDFESFKSIWQRVNKQKKGDVVEWEGTEFLVEEVKPDKAHPGQNIYLVCRMDTMPGMKLQVLCHHIQATPDELKAK